MRKDGFGLYNPTGSSKAVRSMDLKVWFIFLSSIGWASPVIPNYNASRQNLAWSFLFAGETNFPI